MKYVRVEKNGKIMWGVLENDNVRFLNRAPYLGLEYSGDRSSLSECKLLAPCEPSKILAIGKNYYDHAVEMADGIPKSPIVFMMPPTAVNDPEGDVEYPKTTKRMDYECELALIIGKTCKQVKKENAMDYVFAYTCLNDITARDLQKEDGQWTRAKSFDGFAPVGPILTDEVDPSDLAVETRVNGEVKQSSRTSKFMWKIPELIEFISDCMTLLPGDVITTGTPSGIGPMIPGDIVEVEVEGIGVLRNKIVARKEC